MPRRFMRRNAHGIALLVLTAALVGCSDDDKSGEFYTQWDLAGGCVGDDGATLRHDADGRAHDVCAVGEGRWVWVTYAAGWCEASRAQAPAVNRLRRTAPEGLEVFVVLTSGDEIFTVAERGDARAWAASYRFPRNRVLFDDELHSRVVPQHLLIGPDGRTWYRYVGFLQLEAMQQLFDDFASGTRLPDVRQLALR